MLPLLKAKFEGKIEATQSLKKLGIALETIIKAIGLSKEDIDNL